MIRSRTFSVLAATTLLLFSSGVAEAGPLRAGAAKVEITNKEAGPVNDPLYVKALVISDGTTTAAIVTVDAVAIGGIGTIGNDYLGKVRGRVEKELQIPPTNVMVNASHCHGVVCGDVDARTFQAVQQAAQNMVPVKVGAGTGFEDRVQENRRMKLKSGKEIDVRGAYSLPPDEEVVSVGPVDPEIGILRLDREDGRTLAVVYNFACHPIQGVPSGGNTADMTGFASQVIEDNLSDGTIALFLQGCGGDINPLGYKELDAPKNAETLGNLLGLSTLKGARKIVCKSDGPLQVLNETLALPRGDLAPRIVELEAEISRVVKTLQGTTLNLKTFLPLAVKYNLAKDYPSANAYQYLHEKELGRSNLSNLDAKNRKAIEQYMQNIHTMEQLTRMQTNLALLRMHHVQNVAAGKRTVDVELVGLRIGDFVLLTFPGELTVRIGLNLKQGTSLENTFIAGYTNGYIYYAPTTEQLANVGGAQEDSDCILAPDWQPIFEAKAREMIGKLK